MNDLIDAIHFFATHPGWLGVMFIALAANYFFWGWHRNYIRKESDK